MVFSGADLGHDLAVQSARNGAVAMSSQAAQFVMQVAGTMILARLLTPDDFGLIAMVSVIVAFGQLLRDAGLPTVTVQSEAITHDQITTLFWVNTIISVLLGVCLSAAAPAVALFYGNSELAWVTVALSIPFVLGGVASQHQALLQRNMMFRTLAAVQLASQASYLIAAIGFALVGWHYWAMVAGTLTSAIVGLILTVALCRWVPGPFKIAGGVSNMLRFGGDVAGFSIANYFARNSDNVMIGRFLGAEALGLYSRAYSLFLLPVTQIRSPIMQVGLPTLRQLAAQPERYAKYYLRLANIVATLTVPVGAIFAVEGSFLIRAFLGSQWAAAVSVFRILAVAGLFMPVVGTVGLVQISLGKSRRYLRWGIIGSIVYTGSFAAGLPFGIIGVAASYTVANYLMLFPTVRYCLRGSPIRASAFFKELVAPVAISIVAGAMVFVIQAMVAGDSSLIHGLALGLFVAVYAGLSLFRKSVRDTIQTVRGRVFAGSEERT